MSEAELTETSGINEEIYDPHMLSTLQPDKKLTFAITWFSDWLVELLQRVDDTSVFQRGML